VVEKGWLPQVFDRFLQIAQPWIVERESRAIVVAKGYISKEIRLIQEKCDEHEKPLSSFSARISGQIAEVLTPERLLEAHRILSEEFGDHLATIFWTQILETLDPELIPFVLLPYGRGHYKAFCLEDPFPSPTLRAAYMALTPEQEAYDSTFKELLKVVRRHVMANT
jgi:hypothetical protein